VTPRRPIPLDAPRERPEDPEHPFAGQLLYQGVPLDIETAAGDYREGTDADGKPWRVRLTAHYGEVRATTGADGDPVDVFVGPDKFAPYVFVIQAKLPGSSRFDETKSMIGFPDRDSAVTAFRAAYTKPGFLLGVTRWPFGAWREAMQRPEVHRGRMTRPLIKAVVSVPCLAAWLR
jgi:hypothetical protein